MIEHKKFHEIGQFRAVVREAPKQVIRFTGTIKAHGTNASIVATSTGEHYAQSRGKVLTLDYDNYGFSAFAHENNLFSLTESFDFNSDVVIYGEWCGKGIQKGVGISKLERMFVIFAVKVDDHWVDFKIWRELISHQLGKLKEHGVRVFDVHEFCSHELDIDFNQPEFSIEMLRQLALSVENKCPIAEALGEDGIGEGMVWSNHEHGLIFKVKGEKHSASRVKTLAAVDVEKLESMAAFVDYALTENRLLQAQSEITPELDVKKLGDLIRWVFDDIIKEELDVLERNNLVAKDIGKYVSVGARLWFFKQQNLK